MDEVFEIIGFSRVGLIPNEYHFVKDVTIGMQIHIMIQKRDGELYARKYITSVLSLLGIKEICANFNNDELIAINRWCRRFIENVQLCDADGQSL